MIMKTPIATIFLFFLLIVGTQLQNPETIATDQNYIEATAVNPGIQAPPSDSTVNNQPVQPQVNNEQPTQNKNKNQIKLQGLLLSNEKINGSVAQAIPVDPIPINQVTNEPIPQMTQQAMAKQAEKAKNMAQQAVRQMDSDRRTRDQKQDDQLRFIQSDQTLTKTQRKKKQEKIMFKKKSRIVEQGTRFTEYLFEQGLGASEFFIKLPAAQQVAINFYTYVAQDNTYVRTKNIEEEEPVKVYIYENNQNIVYQGEFYYQNYITFQGQEGASYLIKVVNNGRTKLISMSCKKLVEVTDLEETLQRHEGQHVERTQNLAIEISRWHQEFRKIRMLDFQDLKSVQGFIQKYYFWELIETVLAIGLCGLQVQMIQNMFKGNSIV